jgi:ribosomal protein S1
MWVKTLAGLIQPGTIFNGIVRRIAEFGLFVELVPGKDGLLHVSAIPREKQRNLDKEYPLGSNLKVQVVEYDAETDRVRLKIIEG